MDDNTEREQLIIPDYGRHVQKMVAHATQLTDIEEKKKCIEAIIGYMGQLNPHLRDIPDYKHKLWDHLFTMCKHQLNIESPYPRPAAENKKTITRMHNTQGSVKNKHYGKLILSLIQEAVKIKDTEQQNQAFEQIAKQMKRAYLNWNQTNVQDTQIWNDLEKFTGTEIKLDKSKVIPVFQPTNRKKTFYKKPHKKNYVKK